MKQLLALFFLIVSITSFIAPIRAAAFSQCHSERKGYCIKLDPPDSGQNASQNSYSRSFALPFPGLEFLESYGVTLENKDVGTVISALYNFGVAIAAVSALIMFTYGGMRYLTAGQDSSSAISSAKKIISNAVLGLVLIVLSYLLLYIINPDFTFKLKIPDLKDQISPPGGSYAQSSYTGYSQSSYTGYSQSSYYAQSSYAVYSQSSYATYSQAGYADALCTTTKDSCGNGFKCVGGHCVPRD